MEKMARQVAREVKEMTLREIITKAIDGQNSWVAAADIIGVTPRHMGRIRRAIESGGISGGDGPARRTAAAQADSGADHPGIVPA